MTPFLCSDFDPVTGGQRDDKKERYLLDYLGSVETSLYKGCSNSSPPYLLKNIFLKEKYFSFMI